MLERISEAQTAYITLWYLVQHSLSCFAKLEQYFGSVAAAVRAENLCRWKDIKIHANHIRRAESFYTAKTQQAFDECIQKILRHSDFILLQHELDYPQQLLPYADRPPILFGKGAWQNLNHPQVAIVGSRKPSPHGKQVAYDFAYYLSEKGFYITSGLAEGIDEAAHLGALPHHRTIAVVGTGIDQIYPSQNRFLQDKILQYSGVVITEFLPDTKPLQHNFPRRNRIVSGLSLAVLVAEATLKSGSLITAKAAAEQGKMTFAIPGHIYSEHHQGCHQLIRDGAVLVDHPEQMIEDLALPTQWHYQRVEQSKTSQETQHHRPVKTLKADPIHAPIRVQRPEQSEPIQIQLRPSAAVEPDPVLPEYLFRLYQHLDWVGIDLDTLSKKLDLSTAQLTSHLMELELLGLCIQQFGVYLRCRSSH
ncbi:DNA processing protein [Acinetobacter calcoaceticus]|uniref:DNA processing protein n=1 Tax=Acinetobacter calcoaceticus TaxID=471 RepID=A0A4R1XKR2_ACICA|nr:DNA processing protein [Acinetobacter calcoaceticus]